MGTVIAIVNQKGGAGKSTVALNLAHFYSTTRNVLLIDADPQASIMAWRGLRRGAPCPTLTVMAMALPVIHEEIPKLLPQYQTIIIDCPPRLADVTRSALAAADLCIMPMAPSAFDILSCHDTMKTIKEAQMYNTRLRAFAVINRLVVRSTIGDEAGEATADIGIPTLRTRLGQRVDFIKSLSTGRTVLEHSPDGKAAAELAALGNEIMEVFKCANAA